MKGLFTLIAILVMVAGISYAERGGSFQQDKPPEIISEQKETFYIVTGTLIENKESLDFYQQTGCVIIFPFDMDTGVRLLGDNGFICDAYGHDYVDGKCRFCGKGGIK